MKGKQATLAARRRAEAAHEVIDRLTTDLADAKLRAKEAERRAAQLQVLADRAVELQAERDSDTLLGDALSALDVDRRWGREQRQRTRSALKTLRERLIPDVITASALPMSYHDGLDFVLRRYGPIMDAIFGQHVNPLTIPALQSTTSPTARKLSEDQRRRLERLNGLRTFCEWDRDRDTADVWTDMLEGQEAGFDGPEIAELIGLLPGGWPDGGNEG